MKNILSLILIILSASSLKAQTILEKEIPRPSPLPDILSFVMESQTACDYSEEQITAIQKLVENFQSPISEKVQRIYDLDLELREMSKQSVGLKEMEALNKKVIEQRLELNTLKLDFRDALIAIIGRDEYSALTTALDEKHPFEMGLVVERISPIPNYMIVAYYIEGMKLTEDQKQHIDHWNEEGHYKAMLMLSKMAEKEQKIRTMTLENQPKADIIEQFQAYEMMRHNLLITKTNCRDYIRDEVLEKWQWELMIEKMDL